MRIDFVVIALATIALILNGGAAGADGSGDPKAVRSDNGKYYDKDDTPTFNVKGDGTVDWYTYSGFRRYHSECHVCHGPDGEGSTYAPGVKTSPNTMTYAEFFDVVVNGRKRTTPAGAESVMPSLGLNANVMCYLDDIFVYLRARANDALGRGRPERREQKPEAAIEAEKTCLGEKG